MKCLNHATSSAQAASSTNSRRSGTVRSAKIFRPSPDQTLGRPSRLKRQKQEHASRAPGCGTENRQVWGSAGGYLYQAPAFRFWMSSIQIMVFVAGAAPASLPLGLVRSPASTRRALPCHSRPPPPPRTWPLPWGGERGPEGRGAAVRWAVRPALGVRARTAEVARAQGARRGLSALRQPRPPPAPPPPPPGQPQPVHIVLRACAQALALPWVLKLPWQRVLFSRPHAHAHRGIWTT